MVTKTSKRNPNSTPPEERPNDLENPTHHGASVASNKENLPTPSADKNRYEYTPKEMEEASRGGIRHPQTHIGTHSRAVIKDAGSPDHSPYGNYPNPSSGPNASIGIHSNSPMNASTESY